MVAFFEPLLAILDHYEPDFDVCGPPGMPRCELISVCFANLFYEDGTIREFADLIEGSNGFGLGVYVVHLVNRFPDSLATAQFPKCTHLPRKSFGKLILPS